MRRIFFNDRDLPLTFLRKGEGFTLVESMVILSIIAILSIATFPAYKTAKENLALHRSANMLAQDIRLTIEKAMSAQEAGCSTVNYQYQYGISLKEADKETYILFADCNNNNNYDLGQDQFIEQRFEEGIEIKGLNTPSLDVVFKPPDPTVNISAGLDSAQIIIGIVGEVGGITKTITINKAGLIDID